jgi:hypothetical protein
MLVEAIIFSSEDGLLQSGRNIGHPDVLSSFFAELSDQYSVRAPHAQRDLGAIVRQRIDRRQVRVGDCEDKDEKERRTSDSAHAQYKQVRHGTPGTRVDPLADAGG